MATTEEKTLLLSNLPPEIIEIILTKLSSVKSLLRFKTVSKSWNKMISDPVFVEHHLQKSPNNLFLCTHRIYCKLGFSLVKLEGQKFHTETLLKNSSHNVYNIILRECNGVLLLSDSRCHCPAYMLWNPSTQREIHFESPYEAIARDSEIYLVNPGMCYDSITDDFKVVLIALERYAIYSCKDGSWKEKKLGRQYHDIGCPGIYVDGAIYWLLGDNLFNTELVYFDPGTDELKTLQKPKQLPSDGDDDLCIGLTCLRGKLCLYYYDDRTKTIQILIQEKRTHVGESPVWKELIITFKNTGTWDMWSEPKPICYMENKILFRLDQKRFVYYSTSEKTFEEFEEIETDIYCSELLPFRNSLHTLV